jgi:hypothetical protein
MIKLKKIYFFIFTILGLFSFTVSVSASNINGTISPSPKYAFGENLGWINFGCDNCNVHVTDTGLSGYAWSRQYGWINLSPDGSGVTNNCLGQLGGKAWSKSLGWLDFSGVTINAVGQFTGMAGTPSTKAGRVNFDCTSCDVSTDWRQCALRESPAQVVINSITDNTIPSVTASITITNEGSTDTEYQYEWCVVSDIGNACGGGDDVFYSSGAKLIVAGQGWTTTKDATVPIAGVYYFKLVVFYGANSSSSTQLFDATTASGGSSGSSGGGRILDIFKYNIADFNRDRRVDSIDFSILLYFWKNNYPFTNIYVDINKDNKVDSIDFSILLYQWGK